MSDLLDGVAKKYPNLERDAALGKIGRENFRKYVTKQPGAYARMVASKMWNVWRRDSGPTMRASGWVAFHYVILALAIVGLAVLALRRRWEALVLGILIGGITVLGGLLLAVPRRNVPLIPLVCALAATGGAVDRADRARLAGRAPGRRRPLARAWAREPDRVSMELSAIRVAGLVASRADRGLRDLAPPHAAQRRRPDPAVLGARRSRSSRRRRSPTRCSRWFSFQQGRRRADPRPRRLRDRHAVPADAAEHVADRCGSTASCPAVLEGIAWEEFRPAGLPERFGTASRS